MEDNLQCGEYAKFNDGTIRKILLIEDWQVMTDFDLGNFWLPINRILKHSFDILSLINVGDFVNDKLVIDIDSADNRLCLLSVTESRSVLFTWINVREIHCVFTRDQMDINKYKVEIKLEDECERYKLALFSVIRNSSVLPKGLSLNKTESEINEMTYDTMKEVLNMIDFDTVKAYYINGKGNKD